MKSFCVLKHYWNIGLSAHIRDMIAEELSSVLVEELIISGFCGVFLMLRYRYFAFVVCS